MMMKPFRLKTLAVIVALTAFGLSAVAQAETVKIALAVPTTGSVAQYGDMVQTGALTAIEQINAAGGVNGSQLQPVVMDDACDPKQGVNVANEVVSQNIHFVIGHVCTGATIPASEIYENNGIVMVTPSATGPAFTVGKHRKFIFRTIGRDDQQGPVAADYIINQIKPKKVAVLHDKQSYGQGIATSVKDALDKAHVPVVIFEGINAGDSDYSAVITKLKAAGVDFVYFGGYHPEMGLLLRQGREQGLKAQFMGPEGVGNKDVTAIAGPACEGMLVTLPADFSNDPANAGLMKVFAAKKRDPNGPFVLTGYAAAEVIGQAIAGAKSADPAKVAAYIHQHTFDTPIGKLSYDDDGDLKAAKFVVYRWHKDSTKTPAN
jgi:branched-chain amino acid transport system substrate-binding protein